jgi:hypothetical protein
MISDLKERHYQFLHAKKEAGKGKSMLTPNSKHSPKFDLPLLVL